MKFLKSIKPHTYDVKASLPEHIGVKIIYYRKLDKADILGENLGNDIMTKE